MSNLFDSIEIQELIKEHGAETINKILNNRKKFYLYFDNFPAIDSLPDDKAGILFKNIIAYEKGQDIKEMDDFTAYAFSFIEPRLINGLVECIKTSITNAENGAKGGKAKANKSKIPTEEEFINYCVSKGKESRKAIELYHMYKSSEWDKLNDWHDACDMV